MVYFINKSMLQIEPLQAVIGNAVKKRIIVFDIQSQTPENASYVESLNDSIDKRHHPVQIIRQRSGANPAIIEHVIVCKDPPRELVTNKYENGKWFMDLTLDVDSVEGYESV